MSILKYILLYEILDKNSWTNNLKHIIQIKTHNTKTRFAWINNLTKKRFSCLAMPLKHININIIKRKVTT